MKKLSLKAQLLIYMMILTCIPLLIFVTFSNQYSELAIDQQANDYATQMLKHVRMNVDSNVQTVDHITKYLASDPAVLDYLRLDSFYDENRIELETTVRDHMMIYYQENRDLVGGILIAGENELYASNEMYRITRTHPLNDDYWYQQAVRQSGGPVLISGPIGRNIRNYQELSSYDIVSVLRTVYDPETGELLGVICVDMLIDDIRNQIRDTTLGKKGYVFIRDAGGEIVYAPVNDTVYRIEAIPEDGGSAICTIGNERYQLIAAGSEITGWTTIGVFHMGEKPESIIEWRRVTLVLMFATVALTAMIAMYISGMFTTPISRLRRLMHEAEEGNLEVSFDADRYSGEIRQLGSSFNKMIDKIRALLQLIYKEQQDKREAEIRTLQAQIKPHFLYNTLDTIRWMAEEHQASDITSLVTALTRLFRISLSRGKEIISLSEEIEHVRSYLYIQKVRYEEKLNYEIKIPNDLLEMQVNKLILQPLVENAIYHGIKQKRANGHIIVEAQRQDAVLILRVKDDGAGMSAERCETLNRELAESNAREYTHGYGIFNVNDRIRLSYGREYGLHYEINSEGGITVELKCPAVLISEAPRQNSRINGGKTNGDKL